MIVKLEIVHICLIPTVSFAVNENLLKDISFCILISKISNKQ